MVFILIKPTSCMENNDILRRLRFTLNFNNSRMQEVFALADQEVAISDVKNWLKKDDQSGFVLMPDVMMATFLNGLIIMKRGKREGPQPVPETEMNNNLVLKKLKIAFDLQSDDMLEIYDQIDKGISPHELSSFFRSPESSKYRECNDQYLRNFLTGLQVKYRDV